MPRLSGIFRSGTIAIAIGVGVMLFPLTASAKCPTARIDIGSNVLDKTLAISDPAITSQFHVWNGPRVRVGGKHVHLDRNQADGRFIDWPLGPVGATPESGRSFQISFFCGPSTTGEYWSMYQIDYVYEHGVPGGHIYIPGPGDSRYRSNVSTIVHGVEGKWYRSTPAWEQLVRPLISKATEH